MRSMPANNCHWFRLEILFFLLVLGCTGGSVQSQSDYGYLPRLKSEEPEVRKKALKDLAAFFVDPLDVPEYEPDHDKWNMLVLRLVELSHDPDPEIREWTIRCLVSTTHAKAPQAISSLLKDKNDIVRATAAGAFLTLVVDDPKIIRELERLLNDPNEDVRINAAASLGTNGTRSSLIVMQKRLEEEKNPQVREILEEAIERLKKWEVRR